MAARICLVFMCSSCSFVNPAPPKRFFCSMIRRRFRRGFLTGRRNGFLRMALLILMINLFSKFGAITVRDTSASVDPAQPFLSLMGYRRGGSISPFRAAVVERGAGKAAGCFPFGSIPALTQR